jgi:hypothetical protein
MEMHNEEYYQTAELMNDSKEQRHHTDGAAPFVP